VSDSRVINRVRRGFYLDSVALMRLSRELSACPGVAEAALMVGTPSNKEILDETGLLAEDGRQAAAGDVIIALRAANLEAGEAAIAEAETLLGRSAAGGAAAARWRPRSLAAAREALPGANFALISVPGAFAAAEARKALRRGLHVLLFSDNVPLSEECALKEEARQRGLLLMGPDCGTALISGTPLAFANRVRRGSVGIVAASGTGLQEVSSLIDRRGGGVSHGIGVGSRDLSEAVDGAMTLVVIDALEEDPETEHVVLLSKPPASSAARRVRERIAKSRKPYTVCFVGLEETGVPANACWAPTLTAAAEHALGAVIALPERLRRAAGEAAATLAADRRRIRGLFCGGTLCAEAQAVLRRAGELVSSNVPIPGALALDENPSAHRLIDLGSDEFTRGRPHPMLAPEARRDALARSLAETDTAAVLIDVVIGVGAHPDPAGAVAKVVGDARGARPVVVASVCGTEADPQVYSAQVSKLETAGVLVAPSNARAAELALAISRRQA
jgi:FdrA protein